MARKPKIQPSPEAPAPVSVLEPVAPNEAAASTRRGRKAKAVTLSSVSPSAASAGSPATDGAGADVPQAGPTKAPGRRGPGRKPKQAAGAETAPAVSDVIKEETPTAAAASQAKASSSSSPFQQDFTPDRSADEAARPSSEASAPVPGTPAAHWDRTTDRVQFDWPAIEMAAAHEGLNQGMAKLLVAARAEGAQSRWPF